MAPLPFLTRQPIAHRGLHDGNVAVPENSWAAFEAAISAGYSIELDVQLSRDGQAMVFHDATLARLCDRPEAVGDLDASDLAAIKLGETGQTIETLDTIMARIAGRVPVVIEMKDNGGRNPALAASVAETLRAHPENAAAMSFAQDLVTAFHELAPDVPIGLTAEGTTEAALATHQAFMDSQAGRRVQFLSYNVMHLPNAFVAAMRHDRGLPVITWTVRTPAMQAHSDIHADQITFEGYRPELRQ